MQTTWLSWIASHCLLRELKPGSFSITFHHVPYGCMVFHSFLGYSVKLYNVLGYSILFHDSLKDFKCFKIALELI